jgi:hypothetical protein
MSENVSGFFKGLDACHDGASWAKSKKTLREVWETCERSDWMIWALRKIGFKDDRKYRLYACACVRGTPLADGRTLWDLLVDQRSRNAVEVAERYADGKASEEELQEARNAAAAAYYAYAADAADADARTNARKWQADLLRQWIFWDEVEAAIIAYQTR